MRTVLRVAPKQGRFLDGCTTQNMRWLLRTLGATHPDAMMAVEWSFNYRPDTSPLDSSWSMWGSEKPLYFPLERLGLEPQELEYADFNTAWASVRRSIDLGTPVLVGADEHLLPWVRENTSRIYSRYMHMFGIFGYLDDESVCVIDQRYGKSTISLADFEAAWTSKEAWSLNLPPTMAKSSPIELNCWQLQLATRKNLPSIAHFVRHELKDYVTVAVNTAVQEREKSIRGADGIRSLAIDVRTRSDRISDGDIKMLWRRIQPIANERKLAVALFEAAASIETDNATLRAILHQMGIIRHHWMSVQLMLYNHDQQRERADPEDISRHLHRISDVERELMCSLQTAIDIHAFDPC